MMQPTPGNGRRRPVLRIGQLPFKTLKAPSPRHVRARQCGVRRTGCRDLVPGKWAAATCVKRRSYRNDSAATKTAQGSRLAAKATGDTVTLKDE